MGRNTYFLNLVKMRYFRYLSKNRYHGLVKYIFFEMLVNKYINLLPQINLTF